MERKSWQICDQAISNTVNFLIPAPPPSRLEAIPYGYWLSMQGEDREIVRSDHYKPQLYTDIKEYTRWSCTTAAQMHTINQEYDELHSLLCLAG